MSSTTYPAGTAMEANLGPFAMAVVLLHGSDRHYVRLQITQSIQVCYQGKHSTTTFGTQDLPCTWSCNSLRLIVKAADVLLDID